MNFRELGISEKAWWMCDGKWDKVIVGRII